MNAGTLLIFARCAGFLWRAPGFSHPSVSPAIRASFALLLALAIGGNARTRAPDGVFLCIAFAMEAAIGAAIGVAASLLYDGAYAGGRTIDDYTGVRGSVPNASFYASSAFGRIWSIVFTGAFFLLGGYSLALTGLAISFGTLPPGALPGAKNFYEFALSLPAGILQAAFIVAGPAIAIVFLVQFSLGVLSRVIPRFASFTLSFPVVFAAALVTTILSIPYALAQGDIPWLQLRFFSVR